MAEFIKREAVIDLITRRYENPEICTQEINSIPAADVAPVVRCKDCKYSKESRVLAPNKFCFRLNHPTEPRKIGYNFGDDAFCSYGERRDKP